MKRADAEKKMTEIKKQIEKKYPALPPWYEHEEPGDC